jgi:hypothetical protein
MKSEIPTKLDFLNRDFHEIFGAHLLQLPS